MPVELIHVETEDGLRLDGALFRPIENAAHLPVDAFLLLHGTGSNFYAAGVLETFAGQAVERGLPVLRVNLRGHDGICAIRGRHGSVRGGAAYENVAECIHDVHAWLDALRQRGFERIALVGHSMGAVKAIYAQALAAHAAVCRLIALSPPRFCHASFQNDPRMEAFRADYRNAERLVAAGRPDELMQVTQPLPLIVTAAGFVAKYGPDDEYDFLRRLPNVAQPTLIVLGSEAVARSPAFAKLPEAIQEVRNRAINVSLELVEGADVGFSGCPGVPYERAVAWMQQTLC